MGTFDDTLTIACLFLRPPQACFFLYKPVFFCFFFLSATVAWAGSDRVSFNVFLWLGFFLEKQSRIHTTLVTQKKADPARGETLTSLARCGEGLAVTVFLPLIFLSYPPLFF